MSDKPIPIILDTDIGDDIDDAYALALATLWPAVKLEAVTTTFGPTYSRAKLARKLLDLMGRKDIPVYSGDEKTGHTGQLDWAADYPYARPAEPAAEFLARTANERPGELTLVTIGPLPNIAAALDLNPELGQRFKRFVMMAGWIYHSYSPDSKEAEWNVRADIPASKKVFSCGADIAMIGLDVTMKVRFTEPYQKRLGEAGKPWCDALLELTKLWGHGVPTQHDPLATSMVAGDFCEMKPMRLEVDDEGETKQVAGAPNAEAALEVDADRFLNWYVETVGR